MFNYQLFNETYLCEIRLIPANSFISVRNNKLNILKHTSIEEFFPTTYQKHIKVFEVANFFIEKVKNYLPNEFYFQALTGGFDGRTLTACGLYHKKKIWRI